MSELILNSLEDIIIIRPSNTNKLRYQLQYRFKYSALFLKYLKFHVAVTNTKSNITFRVLNNIINGNIIEITIIRTDQNKGWTDKLKLIPNINLINSIEQLTDIDIDGLTQNYNTYLYIQRDLINNYNKTFTNWKNDFIKKYP